MNIQHALLPHKHVRFCDSLLALAGHILTMLAEPRTVDELWALIDRDNSEWFSRPTFNHLIFAIDILYTLGQIQPGPDDRIQAVSQ